ncbi:hypothetical protein [Streptomyces sp. NPDC049881]|uniref:hypothetical protein n=1 Tax=Streptomyces sp. NPDC049881 TaxID=3155778 RepID=UPI0034268D7B
MTDKTIEALTRTGHPNGHRFTQIRKAIQRTEAAAREAMETGHPKAEEAYEYACLALAAVDAILFPANGCAGPDCVNPVQDKGFGRPALYCGPRCKDRAAYLARKERRQRES